MAASKLLQPYLLAGAIGMVAGLAACQPVPLGGNASQQTPRPVKPLYPPGKMTTVVQDNRKPKGAFELVTPGAKPTAKPGAKPGAKPATGGAVVDVSQQLADAADKAASAESLAQFAQTKDDWNQVFDRWKRAIGILKGAPSQTPAIKQKIAAYNNGLEQATRAAEISMNPSLAPVDPRGSRATKALIGGGGGEEAAKAKVDATPKPGESPAAKPEASPAVSPEVKPKTP
jgi:hypothetical protein